MSPSPQPPPVVGLVGAGGISDSHLTAWRDLGVDVVVFSRDGAADLVERVGHGRVAATLDALLAACTVVDVCTPTPHHPEVVEAAAAAGRHVICEKPLALTSVEAARLIEVCSEAGVQLHVAHVVRWFPAYAAAQRHIAAGEVGTVLTQRFLRRGARPVRGWFADPAQSGGVLLDLLVHDIDIARWFAGDVVEVFARDTGSLTEPDAAVSTHVQLRHAGGALSQLTGTWGNPGTRFATAFRVAGDDGLLEHRSGEHVPFVLEGDPAGGSTIPPGSAAPSPYLAELRDLLAAVTDGTPPRVTAQDALAAIAVAEAASRSVSEGVPVRLGGAA